MKGHVHPLLVAAAFPFLLSAPDASAASDNWPQFRGPDGTAVVADDAALPEAWSTTENVAWRTAIPGRGWSSPIVQLVAGAPSRLDVLQVFVAQRVVAQQVRLVLRERKQGRPLSAGQDGSPSHSSRSQSLDL